MNALCELFKNLATALLMIMTGIFIVTLFAFLMKATVIVWKTFILA